MTSKRDIEAIASLHVGNLIIQLGEDLRQREFDELMARKPEAAVVKQALTTGVEQVADQVRKRIEYDSGDPEWIFSGSHLAEFARRLASAQHPQAVRSQKFGKPPAKYSSDPERVERINRWLAEAEDLGIALSLPAFGFRQDGAQQADTGSRGEAGDA